MAENSYPWFDDALGDAGPYTFQEWGTLYSHSQAQNLSNTGVLSGVLNSLEVTTTAVPPDSIHVNSGAAWVDGTYYINTASVDEVMPAAAAGAYLTVLAKDWATQTVRVDTRIGALTHDDGVLWEIPLAQFDLDAAGNVTNLVDTRKFAPFPRHVQGRLSLLTGVPNQPTRTAQTTLYFTPYSGNLITLPDARGGWRTINFTEPSIGNGALAINTNYDVFGYLDANENLALEFSAAWASDVARADAISWSDGALVETADITRLYLGTVRTDASVEFNDHPTVQGRFLWNMYNRIGYTDYRRDATDNWLLNNAAWVAANGGATAWQFHFLIGGIVGAVSKNAVVHMLAEDENPKCSVTSDGVAFVPTESSTGVINVAGSMEHMSASWVQFTGIGYHYAQVITQNSGAGNSTFYGDNGGTSEQAGWTLTGEH